MTPDQNAIVLALAEGRIPDHVDPDSPAGRHYVRWAAAIHADVNHAPPMTDAQKTRIVALLRGGGDHRATA